MQWATEFNNLLVTQGQELCVLGYEGFLRTGSKGAVAVRLMFVCPCIRVNQSSGNVA